MGSKDQGADATTDKWLTIPRALCFITHGEDVLLMKRSPNRRIFPNRYNGIGGHIERDEDPLSGIIREAKEETGLNIHSAKLCGIHNIDAGATTGILMFVFSAISDTRHFTDSGVEGSLHWVNKDTIQSLDLVEDLPHIIPRVLKMRETDTPYFVHVSYDSKDNLQMKFAE